MTFFFEEVSILQDEGILPNWNYLHSSRFTAPYEHIGAFWEEVRSPVVLPIINGLYAVYYALRAVWSALSALSSLCIFRPGEAIDASLDFGVHISLAIALGVMAPVNAIIQSVELLTRIIASWFSADETTSDLSLLSFTEKWRRATLGLETIVFSETYFSKERFFTPYQDVGHFFKNLTHPFSITIETTLMTLSQMLDALNHSLDCLGYLLIGRPKHAREAFIDLGVDLSLIASLAFMIPINAIIETIVCITRLSPMCIASCTNEEDANSLDPLSENLITMAIS